MVYQFRKGSFKNSLIALSMSVQLAGCGGGESSTDSLAPLEFSDSPEVTISSATLTWVAPVARADGTPFSLADIGGYRVYYGATEGNYPNRIDVTDGAAVGTVLRDLPPGTNYFVVTTYDTAGRESGYSDVIIKTM